MSHGRSNGLLSSRHGPHPPRRGPQSNSLDPAAGAFRSPIFVPSANHVPPASQAMVLADGSGMSICTRTEARVEEIEANINTLVNNMEGIIEQMHLLRTDVEALKRGGWTVSVGPFRDRVDSMSESFPKTDLLLGPEAPNVVGMLTANSETASHPELPSLNSANRSANESVHLTVADGAVGRSQAAQTFDQHGQTAAHGAAAPAPLAHPSSPNNDMRIPLAPHLARGYGAAPKPHKSVIGSSPPAVLPSPTITEQNGIEVYPSTALSREYNATNPDEPLPSIEDPIAQIGRLRQPLAIRRLQPLPEAELAKIPSVFEMKTFSLDFLISMFGGNQHSSGFYYIPPKHGACILPSRSFYAFSASTEPYMPAHPGAHGSKLTAFFNVNPADEDGDDIDAYTDVPLFVCRSPYARDKSTRQYIYFGQYSQPRWSDKLDFDRLVEEVPSSVKMYWADLLSQVGRPEWITKQLMEYFWPKPTYDGIMPSDAKDSIPAEEEDRALLVKDVEVYVEELREWKKDAEMKVKLLKKETILDAFDKADAGDPVGLRLWWEYLECIGWDKDFYQMLVKRQASGK